MRLLPFVLGCACGCASGPRDVPEINLSDPTPVATVTPSEAWALIVHDDRVPSETIVIGCGDWTTATKASTHVVGTIAEVPESHQSCWTAQLMDVTWEEAFPLLIGPGGPRRIGRDASTQSPVLVGPATTP